MSFTTPPPSGGPVLATSTFSGYVKLISPFNAVFTVIAVIVGAYAGGFSGFDPAIVFASIVAFLVVSGGFVINNYYDMNIDKANLRKTPIPVQVSPERAFVTGYGLLLAGIIVAAVTLNVIALLIAVTTAFVLDFYSRVLKRNHPLSGNVATSYATSMTFVFGWSAVLTPISPQLVIALSSMFLITFIATIAREFIKAIDDSIGDLQHGIRNITARIGNEKTSTFVLSLFAVTVALTFVPYILGVFGWVYLVLIILVDAAALSSSSLLFLKIRKTSDVQIQSGYAHRTKSVVLPAMALAIVAFGVGLI